MRSLEMLLGSQGRELSVPRKLSLALPPVLSNTQTQVLGILRRRRGGRGGGGGGGGGTGRSAYSVVLRGVAGPADSIFSHAFVGCRCSRRSPGAAGALVSEILLLSVVVPRPCRRVRVPSGSKVPTPFFLANSAYISIGYWPGAIRGRGAGFLEESSGGTAGGDSLEESMGGWGGGRAVKVVRSGKCPHTPQ